MIGAAGTGLAIGAAVASYIYEEGTSGFDANKRSLADITGGLEKMPPEAQRAFLPGAIRGFAALREKRSTLDETLGISDVEFQSAGAYLRRKQRELLPNPTAASIERERIQGFLGGPGPAAAFAPRGPGPAAAFAPRGPERDAAADAIQKLPRDLQSTVLRVQIVGQGGSGPALRGPLPTGPVIPGWMPR
jgi:hypothetical protein